MPKTQSAPAIERPGMSRRAKLLVSLFLAWHVTAVIVAPLAVDPSRLAEDIWAIFKPYLEACYLNHGYHFFGPEPGPSQLVRYEIELADGQRMEGIFPDKQAHWPRLLYHRHFMLSSRMDGDLRSPVIQEFAHSYARHLHALHAARSVTLYRRTHALPPPEAILEGTGLDDPRWYREDKLTTYAGEQP